jgi:hypothetical protein
MIIHYDKIKVAHVTDKSRDFFNCKLTGVDIIPAKNKNYFLNNYPRSGFTISSHSMYRQNPTTKQFYASPVIVDPSGFTKDVRSDLLLDIIQKTTVVDGVITDPLVWLYDEENNIWMLDTSDSDNYKRSTKIVAQSQIIPSTPKLTWAGIKIGDILEHAHGKYVYIGKFHQIYISSMWDGMQSWFVNGKEELRCVAELKNGKLTDVCCEKKLDLPEHKPTETFQLTTDIVDDLLKNQNLISSHTIIHNYRTYDMYKLVKTLPTNKELNNVSFNLIPLDKNFDISSNDSLEDLLHDTEIYPAVFIEKNNKIGRITYNIDKVILHDFNLLKTGKSFKTILSKNNRPIFEDLSSFDKGTTYYLNVTLNCLN